MTGPACPVVLALLAGRPHRAHELARSLDGDYPAAVVALRRLEARGLVPRRRIRTDPRFAITRRGAAELAQQRRLWASVLAASPPGWAHPPRATRSGGAPGESPSR